jgi:hypothetical protein
MNKTKLNTLLKEKLVFPAGLHGQRSYGDVLEHQANELITESFSNVDQPRSVRSIEDLTVDDCYVDHKTSDEALKFKMPNLISIDRLIKIDKPLYYNFIIYNSEEQTIVKNFVLSVYELNWEHLAIQNLGKGQLQIKSMKEFLKSPTSKVSKEEWLSKLKEEAIAFYKKIEQVSAKRADQWKNLAV